MEGKPLPDGSIEIAGPEVDQLEEALDALDEEEPDDSLIPEQEGEYRRMTWTKGR